MAFCAAPPSQRAASTSRTRQQSSRGITERHALLPLWPGRLPAKPYLKSRRCCKALCCILLLTCVDREWTWECKCKSFGFSPLSALIFGGFAATIRLWDRLCTNAQLKHILDTRLQDPSLSETKASKLTSHISWTCLRTSMDTVRLYKVCGSRWDGASILTKVHCLGCLYSLFHKDLSAMDKESSLWKDTFSVYDAYRWTGDST